MHAPTFAVPPSSAPAARRGRRQSLHRRSSLRHRRHQPPRRPLRAPGDPPRQPHAHRRRQPQPAGSIRWSCRSPISAIFAIALGDIPRKPSPDRGAGGAPIAISSTLGGDHTITLRPAARLGEADAVRSADPFRRPCRYLARQFRADLRHGSVFYHAINEGLVDPTRMMQIGIRSPVPRSVWDWTDGSGCHHSFRRGCAREHAASRRRRRPPGGGRGPVYLSFDIDALDPVQAPEPARRKSAACSPGRRWPSSNVWPVLSFVGMDVVEVSPPYDIAEILLWPRQPGLALS